MDLQMTLHREPADLLEFSLAVQETLRSHLGDALVDSARSILEVQQRQLNRSAASPRLPEPTEKALLQMLAEIVLADGVACALEDEAASTYILDHLAVDEADGERLLRAYEDAKTADTTRLQELPGLEKEDREAIFDACCKVAWADQQLKPEEDESLQSIGGRLGLSTAYARSRISDYGEAVQRARSAPQIYAHVEVAQPSPTIQPESGEAWQERSIQLLAIYYLAQKKGAKISPSDTNWCSVLGTTNLETLEAALRRCPHLTDSASGFTLKPGSDEASKRQLIQSRNEATLLRLLLGNGAPLTSRFLSFRINPPKPFPELELIRLAETSPALVRYGIGNGKWLGARAWGAQGANQLVKEDWSLIKRDIKKHGTAAPFSELEWEAIRAYAEEQNETGLAGQNQVN